jgi:3-mercaptopyruvate sulfurtransferase SseA
MLRRLLLLSCLFLTSLAVAAGGDPWTPVQVVQPQQLAERLKPGARTEQPLLLHVGFEFLYRNGHIPGSIYAGPANEAAGPQRLRAALEKVPRNREIVIYCGCCPIGKCPNVRPAFKAVQAMGFTNVRVLHLSENLEKNWASEGFPVEKRQ